LKTGLSTTIIVINPNRIENNVHFKIRKQKSKIPSTIDEKNKNFFPCYHTERKRKKEERLFSFLYLIALAFLEFLVMLSLLFPSFTIPTLF